MNFLLLFYWDQKILFNLLASLLLLWDQNDNCFSILFGIKRVKDCSHLSQLLFVNLRKWMLVDENHFFDCSWARFNRLSGWVSSFSRSFSLSSLIEIDRILNLEWRQNRRFSVMGRKRRCRSRLDLGIDLLLVTRWLKNVLEDLTGRYFFFI